MYGKAIKRIVDFTASMLMIVLLSPALLVLALLIKLSGRGPVFFVQRRIGKNERQFNMLKFRSMRTDAPKDMPTHLLKDPYAFITPIGKFLRKSSLDELPQLFNILSGKMSFVGPRPALWNQDDLIAERRKYGANDLRPGLTGLAQISGRDELPIAEKARLDGEYCKRVTFTGDCKILWRTAFSVASGDGVSEGGPN